MKLSGAKVDNQTWMLASAADCLAILVWQNTENGQKGRNMPTMFTDIIIGNKQENDVAAFNSPEEYEAARKKFEGGDD